MMRSRGYLSAARVDPRVFLTVLPRDGKWVLHGPQPKEFARFTIDGVEYEFEAVTEAEAAYRDLMFGLNIVVRSADGRTWSPVRIVEARSKADLQAWERASEMLRKAKPRKAKPRKAKP